MKLVGYVDTTVEPKELLQDLAGLIITKFLECGSLSLNLCPISKPPQLGGFSGG